jgi:sulfide dehydrogenase cytochrome subunit
MAFSLIRKASWLSTTGVLFSMWLSLPAWGDESSTHIRTLASSCITCHGDNLSHQSVIPGLTGLDQAYFIKKMSEYRSSDQKHEVMVQHAKGLTEAEIEELATYFAHQARACPITRRHPARPEVEK